MELVSGYTIYLLALLATLLIARFYKINLRNLIYKKGLSSSISWVEYFLLIGSLLVFSIGTFILTYVPLSYLFPEFVSSLLNEGLIYTSNDTTNPVISNLLLFLMLVFFGPVIEEIIFRGVMFNRVSSRYKPQVAAIAISCLFGLLHADFIGGFVFGLIMTTLYLKTKNLMAPMVCHILNNFLAYAYSLLTYWLYGKEHLYSLDDLRNALWIGVICVLLSTPIIIYWLRKNWKFYNSGSE